MGSVEPSPEAGSSRDGSVFDGTVTPPPPPQDASPASCTKYCELTLASCTGAFAQYTDLPQCVAVCETLPLGLLDDRTGNTIGCRQAYAGNVAKTDPARFCPVAGPFGGGVCGERCDAFCAIALAICPKTPWATPPACVSACTNLSYVDAGSDAGGEGLAGPTTGDTLNCRTRRLLEAISVPEQCEELGSSGACSAPDQ